MNKKVERKFKKGDKVLVRAIVETKGEHLSADINWSKEIVLREISKSEDYSIPRPFIKCILNRPFLGLVVGWSTRISGLYRIGDGGENPGDIVNPFTHRVLLVCPMTSERWQLPIACLEEDLDKLS